MKRTQKHIAMEDKQLNAAESIALISRMIDNTRSRMVRNAGRPFLAWGYATAATLIAVWAAVSCTGDIRWNYLWFMLPLLGGALMYFTRPKATEGSVHTYVDRVLDLIWSVIGPATLLISTLAICFVVRFPVAFTVLLMIGLGTTINNLIIGFSPAWRAASPESCWRRSRSSSPETGTPDCFWQPSS